MMAIPKFHHCVIFLTTLYSLQLLFYLQLRPNETENIPASFLPSRFERNHAEQQHAEHESNAGNIQKQKTADTNPEASEIISTKASKASEIIATGANESAGNSLDPDSVFFTDMGVRQIGDMAFATAIQDRLARARIYLDDVVAVNSTYDKVRSFCKNKFEFCAWGASQGQCDKDPQMKFQCAPVCESCEQMDVDVRCRVDPDAIDALYPGDLDRRYENITTNPAFEQYGRRVLSRPSYAPGDTAETADYQLGPWLVVFDNALSDEESDKIIELGSKVGFARSTGVGKKNEDGSVAQTSVAGRTSTNAWCFVEWCAQDPIVQRVMNRIATITGIGDVNYEHLQILRYKKGEYYKTHNDFIDYQATRSSGVRLLTFYVYLSDLPVDGGGGTKFPHLNLTVTPKKGRAVLWPSVLNEDPMSKDNRTDHAALTVKQGVKYGFNAWIHQRDFKSPHKKNCQ
jgi:prolyl 4-hydroxylase